MPTAAPGERLPPDAPVERLDSGPGGARKLHTLGLHLLRDVLHAYPHRHEDRRALPERLPRVARMAGTLLGRAQRYVADVKAEVNRSIELEELNKVKRQFDSAAQDVHQSIAGAAQDLDAGLQPSWSPDSPDNGLGGILAPFVGIKLIDALLVAVGLVLIFGPALWLLLSSFKTPAQLAEWTWGRQSLDLLARYPVAASTAVAVAATSARVGISRPVHHRRRGRRHRGRARHSRRLRRCRLVARGHHDVRSRSCTRLLRCVLAGAGVHRRLPGRRRQHQLRRAKPMMRWAIIFLVVALVAVTVVRLAVYGGVDLLHAQAFQMLVAVETGRRGQTRCPSGSSIRSCCRTADASRQPPRSPVSRDVSVGLLARERGT